jgi:hypothetical protein
MPRNLNEIVVHEFGFGAQIAVASGPCHYGEGEGGGEGGGGRGRLFFTWSL